MKKGKTNLDIIILASKSGRQVTLREPHKLMRGGKLLSLEETANVLSKLFFLFQQNTEESEEKLVNATKSLGLIALSNVE